MFIEIDEEVDARLPNPIVDDDGDVLTVTEIIWMVDNPIVSVIPQGDGMTAIVRANGAVGQAVVTATVTADGDVSGDYTGTIAVGMGIPVGGELGFGTPRKITP